MASVAMASKMESMLLSYPGCRLARDRIDSEEAGTYAGRNLENLSDVTCTLDTHFPSQIFSPSFWLDENGEPPAPHQEITTEDIRAGRMRPNPDVVSWVETDIDETWLAKQVESYCAKLEKNGKYKLYLWPPTACWAVTGTRSPE